MRMEVVADFRDERWPSMDLAAEMLVESARLLPGVECTLTRPRMWRASPSPQPASAFERAFGRYLQYPLELLRHERRGRCFHVADHSYAHLLHTLPARRSGVYCHDIDAFRAILAPKSPSASRRALSTMLLSGMRRAAIVFHSTQVVRDEILERRLVAPDRLVHAPFGIASEFGPNETCEDERVRARHQGPFVLNVGSCIARKNVPFLLRLFAGVRATRPALRLVQIGGSFTPEQTSLLRELGVTESVVQLRDLSRAALAAYYRQARVVVQPTLAEGFGLPLTEAMACGACVLASDLPVLREVGGAAVRFVAAGDQLRWRRALVDLLDLHDVHDRSTSLREAARFSWTAHARTVVGAYERLLSVGVA